MSKSVLDLETPVGQIIEHLQRQKSSTIKELEQVLGITTTAVRQHLNTLLSEGYIERRRVSTGVGRPHYAYFATEKVQELFACHCDDLALTLLEEVLQLEGVEKTSFLLDKVGDRLAKKYKQSVQSIVLQERVHELAGALNHRGVLTDVETGEISAGEQITLKTYSCPYHELANEHREVCAMDQEMIQKIVGADVSLESSMMDGHNCCTFVVSSDAVSSNVIKEETFVSRLSDSTE